MIERILIILAGVGIAVGLAFGQEQIPSCAKRDVMARALAEKAKEFPIGIGLASDMVSVLEVFVSAAGTYTIVVTTMIDGKACIEAYGTGWQTRLPSSVEKGA